MSFCIFSYEFEIYYAHFYSRSPFMNFLLFHLKENKICEKIMESVFLVEVIFVEVCAYFRSFLNCSSMNLDSFSVSNFLFK